MLLYDLFMIYVDIKSHCIQIPESPYWLLSKHRDAEALRSLQWLRGWVPPEAVKQEFDEMRSYIKKATACLDCDKKDIPCSHPPSTLAEKLRDLMRKRVLKPSLLMLICSCCSQFSGMTAMRPYVVLTLSAYGVPMDTHWAAVSL